MPELAEVEYYRKCWDCGLGHQIVAVKLHSQKRIFRGIPVAQLEDELPRKLLTHSESRGKQLLFVFSPPGVPSGAPKVWLGLHLGMTGKLQVGDAALVPGKHDHLVLVQRKRALVFHDPRQFGRVQFHHGTDAPVWWKTLPPTLVSAEFTRERMIAFLNRHRRLSIKPALLLQAGFPGIGNWMADEILWRAKLNPLTPAGRLSPAKLEALWTHLRYVCRGALRSVAKDFSDPPRSWLFHERWNETGRCPIHKTILTRRTVGGRTTAWCQTCQRR